MVELWLGERLGIGSWARADGSEFKGYISGLVGGVRGSVAVNECKWDVTPATGQWGSSFLRNTPFDVGSTGLEGATLLRKSERTASICLS